MEGAYLEHGDALRWPLHAGSRAGVWVGESECGEVEGRATGDSDREELHVLCVQSPKVTMLHV